MLLSVLLAATLTAREAGCSKPVPSGSAGNYITPGVLGDLAYRDGLTLDAYAPPGDPRPAAIIIHGAKGNKRTHITQLFEVLERAGYAWFSLDYQSAEDIVEAVRYIRCPGRFNLGGDVVLVGTDTGGPMALDLAAQGDYKGVVVFGGRFEARSSKAPAAPDIPVLIFHGTTDDEAPVGEAVAFCRKLRHCELHAIRDGIHDFENWHPDRSPDQWAWKEDLTAWLRGDRRGLWKNIAYSRSGGRELLMDCYIPDGAGPFPAVVIAHGGGWEAGDKVTYISPVFEPLARAGFAWFSIDYRLTPYVRVPDQLEDLRNAIRYVREHAPRFHVDPARIALLGESASGHLAAQVGSDTCPGCAVQAIVSFYGVYDFTGWSQGPDWQRKILQRLFDQPAPQTLRRYSPIFYAKPDMPPVLLIQGTADELDRGTEAYAAKLKQIGAHYELLLLPGAPHGMENWEGHPQWMFYKQKLVNWLRLALGNR